MSKALVVGIAGGTASGKTTVARKIVESLKGKRIAFLDQDSYYKDLSDLSMEERLEINFDHPDAFDTELLQSHLEELRAGRGVEKPTYDFVHCVREKKTLRIEPGDAVVMEGILVLAIEPIRKLLDLKIFVDADDDVRIIRRLTRDIKERGRDFDAVVHQYFKSVRPMHYGFVEPSKRWADIIIPHGGNNETSVEMVVHSIGGRLS